MTDIVEMGLNAAESVLSPKTLFRRLRDLGRRNDLNVEKEMRKLMDDITLVLAAKYKDWDKIPEADRPTEEDFVNASRAYEEQYKQASGNPKRKLLFRAFLGYFDPKLYRDGMNRILWDYAVELEYPDAQFLAKATKTIARQASRAMAEAASNRPMVRGPQPPAHPPKMLDLRPETMEAEHARRVARMGLASVAIDDGNKLVVTPHIEVIKKLIEFCWEESDN